MPFFYAQIYGGINIMDNLQLCPNCQTGAETVKLDEREPMCPYMECHNGTTCTRFVPIEEAK